MEQEQSAYITSVHLKGYKSIKDVTVTLNRGLNILIGGNGSGKTNFLEFLDAACKLDYEHLFNGQTRRFEIDMLIEPFSMKILGEKIYKGKPKGLSYIIEEEVKSGGNEIESTTYYLDENFKASNKEKNDTEGLISFKPHPTLYLKFENPLNTILKDKLSLEAIFFKDSYSTSDSNGLERNEEFNYFNSDLLNDYRYDTFLNNIFSSNATISIDKEAASIVESIIENNWFSIENLSENLKLFSPIKNIEIYWGLARLTIEKEEESFERISIEGIDFHFFVNNQWVNWRQLSDGTKRLFYLIGSVTYARKDEIILMEEPELGVHPHQLALLMNFLMAKSEQNQIIISTHSPQVLNSLGEDELDNIIVAKHEGKEGTKMYHLAEEEKGYATEYMKNVGFLSDYWMMSGFIQEENPEFL